MTTDDEKDVIEPTTEQPTEEPVQSEPTIDDKINDLFAKFNSKIDELVQTHKSETEQLKEQINSRDKEIEQLKTVNRQIIMSTNVEQKDKEITDFTQVEFDEVDWNREAQSYMAKIDSKIFGTKIKS